MRLLYHRGDLYDTEYLAPSTFIYYVLMNTLGFLYVNVANMNYSRRRVTHSNHESHVDFAKTVCFAPIFYFLGNNVVLRSQHDLSSLQTPVPLYSQWDCVALNFGIWTSAYIVGL